jgi:hypothetical protein
MNSWKRILNCLAIFMVVLTLSVHAQTPQGGDARAGARVEATGADLPVEGTICLPDWIEPAQAASGQVVLTNRGTVPVSCKVTFALQAVPALFPEGASKESGELPKVGDMVQQGALSADLKPQTSTTLDLALNQPLKTGAYLLACRVEAGASRQLQYRHLFVMPETLKSVSAESRFGINAARGEWAPMLRRLGVGWVRFENLKWPFVSTEPGVFRFDGSVKPWVVNVDSILKSYADAGLNVLPYLFLTAGYASNASPDIAADRRQAYPPKDPRDFGEFAFQVAARYGTKKVPADALKTSDGQTGRGYLNHYEIWNEPNLTDAGWGAWVGTMPQYLELLRAAAEGIHRADPAAKISNSGFAGIQVKAVDPLRSYTYADGKHPLDFVDILNVHYYSGRIAPEIATDDFNAHQSGNTTVEEDLRRLLAWRDANKPGLPVWLSETGYDSAGPYGTDEYTQSARLPRMVMLALASGLDKVFVYRESGSTPSMHAAAGLLRDDGTYKPSWFTYATLIRELDGVRGGAVRLPYLDQNVRLYKWQVGEKPVLTAWVIEGTGKLSLNLGKASVTDAFGGRRALDLSGGLDLSVFPVYIRDYSNAQALEPLEKQAAQEEKISQERRKRLAGLRATLFKFGPGAESVSEDVGGERFFTTVQPGDVFDASKGYGFLKEGAEPVERKWIANELDRMAVKVSPGQGFRFRLKPGRYALRLGISPFEENLRVTLQGAAGGEQILKPAKGDVTAEASVEATDQDLTLQVDGYGLLRWLTAIETLPDEKGAGGK